MKTIPLTQGKFAIVDDADFEKVRGHKWFLNKLGCGFYAVRHSPRIKGKRKKILMHRVVTDCPPDLEVNHINGDELDNRRENLQVCTHAQNMRAFRQKQVKATSKFRGVVWHKQRNCWQAQIKHDDKSIYFGCFGVEEAAARAYDIKARELFGDFASLNFV